MVMYVHYYCLCNVQTTCAQYLLIIGVCADVFFVSYSSRCDDSKFCRNVYTNVWVMLVIFGINGYTIEISVKLSVKRST